MVGTKAAKDIPSIKGRAISKFSVHMQEVQTPFLETEEIKSRCESVRADFEDGQRKLNQPMVSKINFKNQESKGALNVKKPSSEAPKQVE